MKVYVADLNIALIGANAAVPRLSLQYSTSMSLQNENSSLVSDSDSNTLSLLVVCVLTECNL